MRTVFRFLFGIPIGFILACFAAAFPLVWPFVPFSLASLEQDPVQIVELAVLFLAQSAQVGSTALLPWALFMVVTEILGWSSLLLHAAAGLIGGFVVTRLAYGGMEPPMSIQTAILLSGLAFALIYWIVAGHGAGRWRRRTGAPDRVES
ncbi:hypothetical protein [Aureimonas frigidaquae]|uniref:hypothetical protein n=1 Tax=Aureimonas frigidaquae TaxID=424757 RepID=UPI0007836A0B|nr:hypothetical protein [Aureimonas frigidaquae]